MLTFNQLQEWCMYLLQETERLYTYTFPLYQLQFDTGCRIGETLDLSRWSENGSNWELITEKSGAIRVISGADLSTVSLNYLRADQRAYPPKFYNRISYQVRTVRLFKIEYASGSDCLTHAFRHYKARSIIQAGGTQTDVKDYYQVTNQVAFRYINEALYKR